MPILRTGGHILLCKRGAGGFPAQGRRLCAVHPEEEGKPAREPSQPRKGGAGGGPGAHRQEGGDSASAHDNVLKFFDAIKFIATLKHSHLPSSTAPRLCKAQ